MRPALVRNEDSFLPMGVTVVIRTRTAIGRSRSAAVAAGTAAAVTLIASSVPWLAASATPSGDDGHKVVVCHWVPAQNGSYRRIVIDESGLNGHSGHTNDIIGPVGDLGFQCPGGSSESESASVEPSSTETHSCEPGDDDHECSASPSATVTPTDTSSATPTDTATAIPTDTATATATPTDTASPTDTATATPTTAAAIVSRIGFPKTAIYWIIFHHQMIPTTDINRLIAQPRFVYLFGYSGCDTG